MNDYETRFAEDIARVNVALDGYLRREAYDASPEAEGLWEAMRYGTLNGGKRIRAVLALEACRACGGDIARVLPAACAIELVHAQSLMHDDLPCMDDDDMRRGKPSVHKAFGESTAVLAGDALIALAFGLIARHTPMTTGTVNSPTESSGAETGALSPTGQIASDDSVKPLDPAVLVEVLADFSDATSVRGLVNGQYVDIRYEGQPYDAGILEYIHTHKTGALFRFALRAGAMLAGAPPDAVARFTRLGQLLGLIFQIVDDLLDIASTSETLGKTAGKDQLQEKATYPAYFGEAASRAQVEQLCGEALALLETSDGLPPSYDPASLKSLVAFIANRIH